jgi:hypothetical protein
MKTAALLHSRSAAMTISKEVYEGSDSSNPVCIVSLIRALKPSVICHLSFVIQQA